MKFGLGSASGMADAMKRMGIYQAQSSNGVMSPADFQKSLDAQYPSGWLSQNPNAGTGRYATSDNPFRDYLNASQAASNPNPSAPSGNGPAAQVSYSLSGTPPIMPTRSYIPRPNSAGQQPGTNLMYAQTASNAGASILPGHQDLGSGVTFHPPSRTYFYQGQPAMALTS